MLTSRAASSLVIDNLCDRAERQKATVACFYFDFTVQKEQSSTNTMGSLLKQVVDGLEDIPEEILGAYQDQKKAIGRRGPRLADIIGMLQTTSSRERTFICIDALDECVTGDRVRILDSLNQILQKSPGTRIFITGRPHIEPEIGRCLAGRVMGLSISPKIDDIIAYLRTKLKEDTIPEAMDSSLEAEILKKIPEKISEMYVEATALGKLPQASTNRYPSRFLLVSLNIDAVLLETTIHRRRQKLSVMTNGLGLGGAYCTTLNRIKGQGGEKSGLGMAALMWISHAERPLKTAEVCHALAVEIGSPNLNTDNVPLVGTLIACCLGLVVVDKEACVVRPVHSTLQEYLRAHPELFGSAHSTMAEICLSYLNSQQIKAFSAGHSPDLQATPFLEYSSLYWGVHAKRDLSDCARLLALKLFGDYNTHISTQILLEAQEPYMYLAQSDGLSPFTGLHCASMFGIVEIVANLVEMEGCDINQMDCGGNTPLLWAAWGGHEGVVKLLLRLDGVNPDKPDALGRTPLLWAASGGHEGVVKILLGGGCVNPNKQDNSGRTPLILAAMNGHGGVVKILLGRDEVSPDKPDNNGRTPLWGAAYNGYEGVVSVLLGRGGVNPDRPDKYGQTPLFCAAKNGQEGVEEILLGREEVSADSADLLSRTPLQMATEGEFEGVVKALLGRGGTNPDTQDKTSPIPLPNGSHPPPTNTGRSIPWFTSAQAWPLLGDLVPLHAGLGSPPLCQDDGSNYGFHLASTDATGNVHPLPAGLGPLPLWQDDDGFYSVLGPPLSHPIHEDRANEFANNALAYNPVNISATRIPSQDKVFYVSSECYENRFVPSSTAPPPFSWTNLEKRLTQPPHSSLHVWRAHLHLENPVQNETGAQPTQGSEASWRAD